MTARSLLVFSRDPGATNVLIATIEALSRAAKSDEASGLRELRAVTSPFISDLKVVTRNSGIALWNDAGYRPIIWWESDDTAAARLIQENQAGLLLTGTSDIDERGDVALWRAAKHSAIESHVVLDHPAHLLERFAGPDGRLTWPNFIYVPDTAYVRGLAGVNAPRQSIRILGDLHHDRLRVLAGARKPEEIASLRTSWGADKSTFVLLFASECAYEMKSKGAVFSFDELSEFESLLHSVTEGRKPGGGTLEPDKVLLVIRPHPRDLPGKYDEILGRYAGPVRVITHDGGNPDRALLAADIVVGMESSLLYEAAILGRPTVSLTGCDIFAGKGAAGVVRGRR
jgi:hypothetical protein